MDIVEQSWAILNLSVLTGETLQISKPRNVIACMIPRMFRAIFKRFLLMKDVILPHCQSHTGGKKFTSSPSSGQAPDLPTTSSDALTTKLRETRGSLGH